MSAPPARLPRARTESPPGRPARILASAGAALPWAGALTAAATIAAGAIALALDIRLGVLHAPFFVQYSPVGGWYALAAAAALAGGLLVAGRLVQPSLPAPACAAGLLVLPLVLRLALNAVREGPVGWYRVFGAAWEGQFEYLPALAALRLGPATFLDRFAELSPALPIHPSAHPPGMVLALHFLGIGTPPQNAALVIGVGALTAPLTYALARQLLDEVRARVAALLYAFAPSSLLYGATSADAVFAALATAAGATLVARRAAVVGLGSLLLALASFFSYALTGVGAWAVLVVARLRGARRAIAVACGCGVALLAGYAALYVVTGFDLLGSLEAAHGAYRRSIASQRPYWYWLFGSPTAFFVMAGLPLAWLALRDAGRGGVAGLALVVVVAIATLLGFTKAETERIWQFLVPLACVAAAAQLRTGRLRPVLIALAVQALAVELLLDTRW
jgi:hypothetical protein